MLASLHHPLIGLILFVIGLGVGAYSSVVGGGAMVLIPLLTVLGSPLSGAIATIRLSALVQQVVSVGAFYKEKVIDWRPAIWVGIFCLPGSYVGAHLVLTLNQRFLGYVVAGFMVLLLIASFFLDKRRLAKHRHKQENHWLLLAVVGLISGLYGGFYGAGFSTLLMMVFIMVAGSTLMSGSANASVANVLMAIPASYVFLRAGTVNWELFWPVTLGGMIGSWYGVEWAAHYGMTWIRTLLIVVVTASVIKLVFFP